MRSALPAPALAPVLLSGGVLLALLAGLSAGGPARASGGSHVVDDSEVEAPGHHLETWGIDGASGAAVSLGVTLRR